MTAEDAFLTAIRAAPGDDTPRLVFADWLEEHGDPVQAARGELMRIQCELARWVPDLGRRTELQERERQLIAAHRDAWLGELRPYCLVCRFARGFPVITLNAAQVVGDARLRESGEAWVRSAWVEGVKFREAELHIADLGHWSALRQVAELDLSGNDLSPGSLKALMESPYLGGLKRLNLANNRLVFRDAQALLEAALGSLAEVDFRNNLIEDAGIYTLLRFGQKYSPNLKRVELHGIPLHLDSELILRGTEMWHEEHCPAMRGSCPSRIQNDLGMQFARIPAGTFLMGAPQSESDYYPDEIPQHEATLCRPYYLGVYPVTQWQYEAVMGVNPSDFNTGNGGGPYCPVDSVTWQDAVEFCRRLSAMDGRNYRLPTEAEWEHACRAGSTMPFSFGFTCSGREANCDGNYPYNGAAKGPFRGRTSIVGAYEPNAFGLYDMHGNVWEWCADWYGRDHYCRGPATDPTGPAEGVERVLRGGSWFFRATRCRSAARLGVAPEGSHHIIGFRVAMDGS